MPALLIHPRTLQLAIVAMLSLALTGCAMKVAPTGGPRDTTPAEVVSVQPASGTTSFAGRSITFVFDDYVDRSIRNAITILPSARFSTSYAGDEITVEFTEPLASNTTYTVTLGTEWTDVRGNRPLSAFTTVFSTGSLIDTGMISGVVSAPSLTNVAVFCYPNADTITSRFAPWLAAPRYVLPTGQSGAFSIRGLANGLYRVIAVRDENRNGLIDSREDFAVAPSDVRVDTGRTPSINLKLGPFIDQDAPMLSRVRSSTSQLLIAQFTEQVFPTTTWQKALDVQTASGKTLPVVAVWTDSSQRDRFFVRLAAPLDTSTTSITLRASSVRDSAGNRSADTAVRLTFRGSALADTTTLRIIRVEPRDSTKGVGREQPIVITFSDAVDTMNAQFSLEHRSPQGAVQVRTRWNSPVRLVIEPQESRKLSTWYSTSIKFTDVRSVLNRKLIDSISGHSLLMEDRPRDPGTMSGTFTPSAEMSAAKPLVIRLLSATGAIIATFQPDSDGTFRVDGIPPGDYTVDVFGDRNRNGRYDYGTVRPFTFGEPWWPLPTKITIRPRWTLENVRISP